MMREPAPDSRPADCALPVDRRAQNRHESSMRLDDHDAIALRLAEIAVEAGDLLRRMESDAGEPRIKGDGTPTTAADLAAEHLILSRLAQTWPGVPLVAEETANQAAPGEHFFLVDPLDGTSDFIRGTGEFTVNIALIAGTR